MNYLINAIDEISLIIASYLLGCICTGYYLVKFYCRKDIRTLGSGNLGARNVGRIMGPAGFIITLAGDAGKCSIVVVVASYLNYAPYIQVLMIILAIVGHIWPIQLRFRGGKGYATMVGGLVAYDFVLFIIMMAVAAVIALFTRCVTLSGLAAMILFPVVALIYSEPVSVVAGFAIIAALLVYAHRDNIRPDLAEIKKSFGI